MDIDKPLFGQRAKAISRANASCSTSVRIILRARPHAAARYAVLKHDLIGHWRNDRNAYGQAKTAFVLDTLDAAQTRAETTGRIP